MKTKEKTPSFGERIHSLRQELTEAIVKLLRDNGLKEFKIPDDYEEPTCVMWVDGDGYAYDCKVKSVSIEGEGISMDIEDNGGTSATIYSGNDVGCEHVEWLLSVHDMLNNILENGK